jgi:hypothetical protein
MQVWGTRIMSRDAFLFLCASAFAIAAVPEPSQAATAGASRAKPVAMQAPARPAAGKPVAARKGMALAPVRYSGGYLQCVTFARDVSGIHLSGNANTWWYGAAGRFARGQRPEVGSVLNFRASGGMRMGHVSVVSRIVSTREILIDDANWAAPGQRKGMVRRGASVIDVSPNNDWTEVRVANGIGSWGRVYPTYGFIYPRADHTAGAERIEIAAARYTPALAPQPVPAPRTTAGSVWTWQGTVAVQTGAVQTGAVQTGAVQTGATPSTARQALRLPTAEMLRPATPTRWAWVNGQAVALD